MSDSGFYISLTIGGLSLIFLIIRLALEIRYRRKHTDKKGWNKCHDCGAAESTMYFSQHFWYEKIYRCSECSIKKYKNNMGNNNNSDEVRKTIAIGFMFAVLIIIVFKLLTH